MAIKPVHSKLLNKKAIIQEAVSVVDEYGSPQTTYSNKASIFCYVYEKSSSLLDTVGQRQYESKKRLVCRKFSIKETDRVLIENEIYSIDEIKENYKRTQLELTLSFVGFDKVSEIIDNFKVRVINKGGTVEALQCLR